MTKSFWILIVVAPYMPSILQRYLLFYTPYVGNHVAPTFSDQNKEILMKLWLSRLPTRTMGAKHTNQPAPLVRGGRTMSCYYFEMRPIGISSSSIRNEISTSLTTPLATCRSTTSLHQRWQIRPSH